VTEGATEAVVQPAWGAGPEAEPARRFSALSKADVAYAGGKGANLGEMTGAGLPIPPGFVVGAPAYASFCDSGGLRERIAGRLETLDVDDTEALAAAPNTRSSPGGRTSRSRFAPRPPPRTPRPPRSQA
jgi:hypothetical protein